MRLVFCTIILGVFSLNLAFADDLLRHTQKALNELGYNAGKPDGAFGSRTENALSQYYEDRGKKYKGSFSGDMYAEIALAIAGDDDPQNASYASQSQPLFDLSGNDFCTGKFTYPRYYKKITRDFNGKEGVVVFIRSIGSSIGAYLRSKHLKNQDFASGFSRSQMQKFARHVTNAAKDRAFEKLWFGNKKGSNPAHWQSGLLANVAYFINLMDHEQLWEMGQRERIVTWGDRLFDQSHRVAGPGWGVKTKKYRWPDTAAMQIAAYALWGATSGNRAAQKEASADFDRLLGLARKDGSMATFIQGKWQDADGERNNLYHYDKTIGYMVVAASAAKRFSADLYHRKSNGADLHKIVEHNVRLVLSSIPADWEKYVEVISYSANKMLRPYNNDGNWGWTEIYMSEFPENAVKQQISKFNSLNTKKLGYSSITLGQSSCMFAAR